MDALLLVGHIHVQDSTHLEPVASLKPGRHAHGAAQVPPLPGGAEARDLILRAHVPIHSLPLQDTRPHCDTARD